jgi:hypothetical protein
LARSTFSQTDHFSASRRTPAEAKTEAGRTSLAQRFTAILRVLKTTKMTWLLRLQVPPETFAERAAPAENYG